MDVERVLWQLYSEFDLRVNDRMIIKHLLENESLSADEICEKADIPKGRVYEYLNDLLSKKLILKAKGQPAKYYIDSLEKRLVDYTYEQLCQESEKQKKIIFKMEKIENISPIINMFEYNIIRSRERLLAKEINYIMRDITYPPFFYPHKDFDEYIDFRTKLGWMKRKPEHFSPQDKRNLLFTLMSNKQMLKKGIPFRLVLNKQSYDFFVKKVIENFGNKGIVERLNGMIEFLKEHNNLKVRVIDEACSYALLVTDSSLIFVIVEPMPDKSFVNGFLLRGKEDVERYLSIFETRYNKGEDLEKVLNETLDKVMKK